MEIGCAGCDFVTRLLCLFASRPRAARAMIILLGEGWLSDADGNDSGTCTCAQQDAEWLAYVDDLQRPETRKEPEDEDAREEMRPGE